MSKNIREILERVHSKDIFIDSALSSLANLIRGEKKPVWEKQRLGEEVGWNELGTEIVNQGWNSAIDHIVKMIEEGL